jgi:hypothetical protein
LVTAAITGDQEITNYKRSGDQEITRRSGGQEVRRPGGQEARRPGGQEATVF